MLSSIAKVHDLLELLPPITIVLKILFKPFANIRTLVGMMLSKIRQRSHRIHIVDMIETSTIDLERCYSPEIDQKQIRSVELHGSGDASEKAYGRVVYTRISTRALVLCRLVASKSKVAPIGGETIPRLELFSGLVLPRLMSHVSQELEAKYKTDRVVCWLDSEISLW